MTIESSTMTVSEHEFALFFFYFYFFFIALHCDVLFPQELALIMVWPSCNCVKINNPIFVYGIHGRSNDAFHYILSNIVLWPLTRLFIFLWNFPEEFVAVAFKPQALFVCCCFPLCVLGYYFQSESEKKEEKKLCIFFFSLWSVRYHGIIRYPLALLLLVFLQADKIDTFTCTYVCLNSIAMHPSDRLRRIKSWKKRKTTTTTKSHTHTPTAIMSYAHTHVFRLIWFFFFSSLPSSAHSECSII